MKIVSKLFFILSLMLLLNQCASLNSVSLTAIPANRSKQISASVDKKIFIFLNFSNDYIYTLSNKLKNKCQGGIISGILTKNEKICYLPFCFIYVNKVTARGYCT